MAAARPIRTLTITSLIIFACACGSNAPSLHMDSEGHGSGPGLSATTTVVDLGQPAQQLDVGDEIDSGQPPLTSPIEESDLDDRYEECVREAGFDPGGVQVLVNERGVAWWVKTGRNVPADIHAPCFAEVEGVAMSNTSSWGDRPGEEITEAELATERRADAALLQLEALIQQNPDVYLGSYLAESVFIGVALNPGQDFEAATISVGDVLDGFHTFEIQECDYSLRDLQQIKADLWGLGIPSESGSAWHIDAQQCSVGLTALLTPPEEELIDERFAGLVTVKKGAPSRLPTQPVDDIEGAMPNGDRYIINTQPVLGDSVEGISAGIIIDLGNADPAIVAGIANFQRVRGDEQTGIDDQTGRIVVLSGSWYMDLDLYSHVKDALGPEAHAIVFNSIVAKEPAGADLPSFDLREPLRWATDDEIPLQMMVMYPNFVVRRGCSAVAVACSPGQSLEVVPNDQVFSSADPWLDNTVEIAKISPS